MECREDKAAGWLTFQVEFIPSADRMFITIRQLLPWGWSKYDEDRYSCKWHYPEQTGIRIGKGGKLSMGTWPQQQRAAMKAGSRT